MKAEIRMVIVCILFLVLGFVINEVYDGLRLKNNFEGLRFQSNNWNDALDTAKSLDKNGDWVCVNIKGMTYERCVEVAQHECGHELFAEILEKHPDKVKEIMEIIE